MRYGFILASFLALWFGSASASDYQVPYDLEQSEGELCEELAVWEFDDHIQYVCYFPHEDGDTRRRYADRSEDDECAVWVTRGQLPRVYERSESCSVSNIVTIAEHIQKSREPICRYFDYWKLWPAYSALCGAHEHEPQYEPRWRHQR